MIYDKTGKIVKTEAKIKEEKEAEKLKKMYENYLIIMQETAFEFNRWYE